MNQPYQYQQPLPTTPPTAWESIPTFVRFAVWLIAILTVLWLVVIPGLFFLAMAGGTALGGV